MESIMSDLLVRNVAAATKAALKKKAKAAGKSVNDLARDALDAAAKPGKEEIWAEIDRIRKKIRARVGHDLPDSTPGIREDRDNR
jgi:plasmid stability protein